MTKEREIPAWNGWTVLVLLVVAAGLLGWWIPACFDGNRVVSPVSFGIALAATTVWFVLCVGFFTLQPNQSAVLLLFGAYLGTVKRTGFHWASPFVTKKKLSLRAHNLNGERLKVNDKRGNPIEIAAVVVWRVVDTAQASFDVEDYEEYVQVQSESAVRHLATRYPYDTFEHDERSLRGDIDEVSKDLQSELTQRLSKAGVVVDEGRLSHLAYAPEIAGAMLQRQQADAIVAARQRIVEGAVGMVEMALDKLEQHETIQLDEERKAAMISNLLVVLCGDKAAHPVVNAGTLY